MWLVDFGLKIALFAEILTEILSYIQKRANNLRFNNGLLSSHVLLRLCDCVNWGSPFAIPQLRRISDNERSREVDNLNMRK